MAAAGNFNMLIGITCSLVAVLLRLASAETVHVVGGTTGWTFPSSTSVYSDWVATQKFQVGDILEFNFATGQHSVATVSKSNYVACNTTSPLALQTTGPVNITVKSGTQYFICTYPGHCAAGQKLAVIAAAASSPSTSPAVAPTPSSPSTAPAPSSTASKSPKASPSVTPTASPPPTSTTPVTATPPTSGAVTPPSPPSPPPSSAPPAAVAGVFLSLLSIAVAILY
ncbi:hypothetical protein Dimus_023500 [Dionaea muscipula]